MSHVGTSPTIPGTPSPSPLNHHQGNHSPALARDEVDEIRERLRRDFAREIGDMEDEIR